MASSFTSKLTRDQIAAIVGNNPRAIKLFEDLAKDVGVTLPNNLTQVEQMAQAALMLAGQALMLATDPGDLGNELQGVPGRDGATGSQGPSGPAVYLEAEVVEGEPGPPGPPGPQGNPGIGATGAQGPMGVAAYMEVEGLDGEMGPPGQPGSMAPYARSTAMTISVGGATAGTTFNGLVTDALDTILYPYAAPAFTSFSFSQTSPLEVGNTIAAGSKTFNWSTSNSTNVAANTIAINDVTQTIAITSGQPNSGSFAYTMAAITKTTPIANTWQIQGTNTIAGAFYGSFSVQWYWRVFYGESALTALASADVLALRASFLAADSSSSYAMVAGNYKYICYPTSMGLKTTFKDPSTGFNVSMAAPSTVSVTNSFGVTTNYYVHRTSFILGGSITIVVSP